MTATVRSEAKSSSTIAMGAGYPVDRAVMRGDRASGTLALAEARAGCEAVGRDEAVREQPAIAHRRERVAIPAPVIDTDRRHHQEVRGGVGLVGCHRCEAHARHVMAHVELLRAGRPRGAWPFHLLSEHDDDGAASYRRLRALDL